MTTALEDRQKAAEAAHKAAERLAQAQARLAEVEAAEAAERDARRRAWAESVLETWDGERAASDHARRETWQAFYEAVRAETLGVPEHFAMRRVEVERVVLFGRLQQALGILGQSTYHGSPIPESDPREHDYVARFREAVSLAMSDYTAELQERMQRELQEGADGS